MKITFNEKIICGNDFKLCPFTGERPELLITRDGFGYHESSDDPEVLVEKLRDMWNSRIADDVQAPKTTDLPDITTEIIENIKGYLKNAELNKISRSDTALGTIFMFSVGELSCTFSELDFADAPVYYCLNFRAKDEKCFEVKLSNEDGVEILGLLIGKQNMDFAKTVNDILKATIQNNNNR
jgi:hypothetical protein